MGKKLLNGLVLAIEPIVNKGKKYIKINKDGWTIDKKPSAHYIMNIILHIYYLHINIYMIH